MTRQRKEIYKAMDSLMQAEQADADLGCGFVGVDLHSVLERLQEGLAATYGMSYNELRDYVYQKELAAYRSGRLPWGPCF